MVGSKNVHLDDITCSYKIIILIISKKIHNNKMEQQITFRLFIILTGRKRKQNGGQGTNSANLRHCKPQ